MGAKKVCLAQRGQQGEKGLGATHFLAEILERVRHRMANREAERAQPERVQEHLHLVANPHRAVLEVAVIEPQPGINEDLSNAVPGRRFDLARKVIPHQGHRIRGETEIAHLARVPALHKADNHRRVVRRNHPEDLVAVVAPGEVQHVGPGFEAGARDGRLVGFHRDGHACFPQSPDDGQQLAVLFGFAHTRRPGQGGFGAHINNPGALPVQNDAPANRALDREANALAIPGVRGEIDYPHDCGRRIKGKLPAADGEFLDASLGGGAVLLKQSGKVFESQHGIQANEGVPAIQALHGFGPRESRAPRIRVRWLWLTAGKI